VSALFLAQVEINEDDGGAKGRREREEQKKSFLEKMRAKKDAKKDEGSKAADNKLFEKQQVGQRALFFAAQDEHFSM
jgi:hypothetical protein